MSTEKSKNVVVTKKARENLVKARAGAITLPKIIGMAFGEGGVSSSGTVIAPTESQSKLNKELLGKVTHSRTTQPADTNVPLQRVNLLEKRSAKSDCMTPMATLCASRPLPGRARMMM